MVPADLATIYDLNPVVCKNAITGKGQTIAVVEDTDLYTAHSGLDYIPQRASGSRSILPG
jgi:subtilase family serine protease